MLPKCCHVAETYLLMVLTIWRLCVVKICLLYKKNRQAAGVGGLPVSDYIIMYIMLSLAEEFCV